MQKLQVEFEFNLGGIALNVVSFVRIPVKNNVNAVEIKDVFIAYGNSHCDSVDFKNIIYKHQELDLILSKEALKVAKKLVNPKEV